MVEADAVEIADRRDAVQALRVMRDVVERGAGALRTVTREGRPMASRA